MMPPAPFNPYAASMALEAPIEDIHLAVIASRDALEKLRKFHPDASYRREIARIFLSVIDERARKRRVEIARQCAAALIAEEIPIVSSDI